MSSETLKNVRFPLCQHTWCTKYAISDRIFWRREIDHQYLFYLTTLRAERDTKYLIEEHSSLLSQIKTAEDTNVELRKEIRMLEVELYLMCERNAHDSYVIDGLHEAAYEADEVDLLASQMRRRLDFATLEADHEQCLMKMLKEEITLLRKKDEEDENLIESMKPLEERLREVLEEEKMKNHQQRMKFKRELEELMNEFQERNSNLEVIKSEKSPETIWTREIFTSFWEQKMACLPLSPSSDTSSVRSSAETERFEVSPEEEIPVDDMAEEFRAMKREYCEFVAMKELLDSKNFVSLHLIYEHLQRLIDGIQNLAEEYMSLFKVMTDVAFIKEYLARLDLMRQKKDVVVIDENSGPGAQRLDQLNLILNSLLAANEFVGNALHLFMSNLKGDFECHVVFLLSLEELFIKAVTAKKT